MDCKRPENTNYYKRKTNCVVYVYNEPNGIIFIVLSLARFNSTLHRYDLQIQCIARVYFGSVITTSVKIGHTSIQCFSLYCRLSTDTSTR